MSDLRTVKSPSLAAPSEVSMGDLRTAQTKSRSSTTTEWPGDIIAGKYKITRRLGHGGMGVVYLALDQKLGREVTIKRLLTGEDSAKRGIDLFLQEARAIAALNHRNIVTIHELGEDGRGPFIVMEYLSGGDLRKAIHSAGNIDTTRSLAIINSLGQGLAYAHGKGIIHRDIKPGNILLDEDGTPKLVDFGLAQMGQESDLVVTGQGMGTMAYMAPEQLRDAKHVDARSDLYALAKTLYHMLTGEVPTTVDLEMVPAEVRPALRQALKNKPEERPASVTDFLKLFSEPNQTPASIPQPDTVVFKAGKCAGCGHQNPENAKFCEGCGAGLFEPCPKCQAENRVGTNHCAACGVKVADFKSSSEALEQAKGLLKDRKTRQTIDLIQVALARGLFQDEFRELLKQAESVESQIAAHLANAKRSAGQGAFEPAIQALDLALVIDPQRQNLLELREEYRNRINQRDIKGHLDAARRSLQERRFDPAIQSCQAVLKMEPSNAEAATMLSQAETLQKDHRHRLYEAQELKKAYKYPEAAELLRTLAAEYPWDEQSRALLKECESNAEKIKTLRQEARQWLKEKQFDKAIAAGAALRQLMPDHPDIAPILANAEHHKTDHQLRVDRVKQLRKGFRYAEAIELLRSLEADYPWDERLKKARIDFEGALKRIETLLQSARQAIERKNFDAVLQGSASIQQLKPDLPEVAALKEQAEVLKKDHESRFAGAMDLKQQCAFAEAADVLRKFSADYAWDATARTELAECEEAATQLETLIANAEAATAERKLPTALAAWESVLALNPNHGGAKVQKATLTRKFAARRRNRRVALMVASLALAAATAIGIIAAADHAHLTSAQKQLNDRNYDSARIELASRKMFWKSDANALSATVDSAQHTDLLAQATADADAGRLDDSSQKFRSAASLAALALLNRDGEHRYIAHRFELAAGEPSLDGSLKEHDVTLKLATSVGYPDIDGAQAKFCQSLLGRADAQEKAGEFADAIKTVTAATQLPNDSVNQAIVSAKLRELTNLAKMRDDADAQKQIVRSSADAGVKLSVSAEAPPEWQAALALDVAAAKAYDARNYVAAQQGWHDAAGAYDVAYRKVVAARDAASRQAAAVRERQSAKESFNAALEACDQSRLKKFGGSAWSHVAAAMDEARSAKDDPTATAAYRHALELLPAASHAEMEVAKATFNLSMKGCDVNRVQRFAGPEWAKMLAAENDAEVARTDTVRSTNYQRATNLLADAIKAGDEGYLSSLPIITRSLIVSPSEAHRVIYVCSSSGSMLSVFGEVKAGLKASITTLDGTKGMEFNVIFFCDGDVSPLFKDGTHIANADNKKLAMDFIDNAVSSGGHVPLPAIQLAMNQKPDSLFFLSDGLSWFGDTADDKAVDAQLDAENAKAIKAFKDGNADGKMRINCIDLTSGDAPKQDHALEQIASDGHGTFKKILKSDI